MSAKERSTKEKMIEEHVEMAKDFLLKEDGTLNLQGVYSLCRNVEREARHLAVKSIQVASSAISNSEDLDADLSRLRQYDYLAEKKEEGAS